MKPKQKNTVGFIVLGLIVYLVLILAVAHYCALAAANPEMSFLDALDALPMHMLLHPFTMVFDIKVIAIVTGVAAFIALYIATEVQVNQHDFAGAEHGSAKWNTDYKGYSKQYSSPFGKASNDGKDNMIMSQHVFLSMNSYKTQINNNVLVIGGSGSGKSRFIIKPNLLQANCSFVCTDPKGELVEACGDVLEKDGYRVVVFNLCDFEASNHYNPFAYVHSDDDIFKLVDCFWRNTTPSGSSKGDPFWDFSAQALLNAVCLYLYHATPKEDQNFTNVIRLLQLCKIDESKSDYKSVLDFMFDQFEQKCMDAAEDCGEPYVEDMAVGQYKIFRSAGQGKTAMSILITCQTRLRHFLSPKMKKFMGTDDIHLDEIGVNKTALFVVMSASDSTYNYIAAMMFSQLFDESFKIAREKYSGKLPIPVRLLLDEFANIGELPEFDKIIAIIRSIGMSATVVLQSVAQLKSRYKDTYNVIIDCCDSLVFLGGRSEDTTKWISSTLGKSTIRGMSRSISSGSRGGSSKSFQMQAKELMSSDEVAMLDKKYCIVMIKGNRPFLDRKFDYTKHKRYKETGDYTKKEYPYREKLIALNNETEKKKVELEDKAIKEKSWRDKKQKLLEMDGEFAKASKAVPNESSGGAPLFKPQDAATDFAEKANNGMKLYDANLPVSFDADYEFADGKEISDEEFLNAASKVKMLAEGSEELVEALISAE